MAGRLLCRHSTKLDLRFATAAKSLIKERPRFQVYVERVTVTAHRGAAWRRLATGGFPAAIKCARACCQTPTSIIRWRRPATLVMARMAVDAGAAIDDSNIGNAFWTPVSVMRTKDGREIRFPHLILDRQKPGLIAVNQQGKRFVNEATSYHEFVEAMHKANETTPTIPAWLVCERTSSQVWARLRASGPKAARRGSGRAICAWRHGRGTRERRSCRTSRAQRRAHETRPPHRQRSDSAKAGPHTTVISVTRITSRTLPRPDRNPPFYAVRVFPGDIGTAAAGHRRQDARAGCRQPAHR